MKADNLANWYFRLNGFLTSQNYILHDRSSERTEIDILGVRFQYKAEKLKNPENDKFEPMIDEAIFKEKTKTCIIMAEVKKGICCLNKPLMNRDKKNIQDFIRVVGAFEDERIEDVAENLYINGFFADESYCVSLFCVGDSINTDLRRTHPKIPQKTRNEVLEFIYNRFEKYEKFKRQHDQWDDGGQQLWECFESNKGDKSNFTNKIISCLE